MAEIRVEPKPRSLAWLWILLLLAIAAGVAWYFLYYNKPAATTTPPPATTGQRETLPRARRAARSAQLALVVAAPTFVRPS